MKSKQLLWLLLLTCVLSSNSVVAISNGQHRNKQGKLGGIQVGSGYSSDMQHTPAQACYNADVTGLSDPSGHASIDTGMYFHDLEKELNIHVSAKGGIDMFSGDAEASYFRSISDKDYSLSLNYYQYEADQVSVGIQKPGLDALNDTGKAFYNNGEGELFSYFGINCGDKFITQFDQGALLIMSLNLEFDSHEDKQIFKSKLGASFADIFSVSGEVEKISKEFDINVNINIHVFQKGGDPSKLPDFLEKDPSGDYYIFNCSLKDMDACTKVAGGMLDYAKDDFATQYDFSQGTGLAPLGLGHTTSQSIIPLGLKVPPSFVDNKVKRLRFDLADRLEDNNYYDPKINELVDSYPGKLDPNSDLYKYLMKLQTTTQNNIAVLMGSPSPSDGALACFLDPFTCQDTYNSLISQMQPIGDLSPLDEIKYRFVFPGTYFYKNGDSSTSWDGVPHDDGSQIVSTKTVAINDTDCKFDIDLKYGSSPGRFRATFLGKSTDHIDYTGQFCTSCTYFPMSHPFPSLCETVPWGSHTACADNKVFSKELSPYYFEKYNGTLSTE